MIIPWLRGIINWQKAPITWMLIAFNVFIFILTHPLDLRLEKKTASLFQNADDIVFSAEMYLQWQGSKAHDHVGLKNSDLSSIKYSRNQMLLIGSQAMRDPQFFSNYQDVEFKGDQVAIAHWKTQMSEYYQKMTARQSSILGLSYVHSPATWITYQFMHASWMHLIGNMLMLLIFAAAVELMFATGSAVFSLGGLNLLLIYLLGGLSGAWFFVLLSPESLTPMVGASGSLSAVMAFYVIAEKRKRVSYYYFISPVPGFYGWIYLPTWLIFPLCFLPDLVGYLSTPEEFGAGIAYTAHMGGAIAGILMGFLYLTLSVQSRDELYSR